MQIQNRTIERNKAENNYKIWKETVSKLQYIQVQII